MNLAELKEAYKARKLALDSAKKEEEKYKALLKDAMLEAGESDYTDEAGYRFERIVQERKSMRSQGAKDNPTLAQIGVMQSSNSVKIDDLVLNAEDLYIADYLVAGYTRQIKVPYPVYLFTSF